MGGGRRTVIGCVGALGLLSGCASSGPTSGAGAAPATTAPTATQSQPSGTPSSSSTSSPARSSSPSQSSTSAQKSTPAQFTPACASSQLAVKLNPLPGAAMGSRFLDIVETNTSSTTCQIKHSVALSVTDPNHQRIAVPVTVPGTVPTVTLIPNASATQLMSYGSDGNPAPGQTTCGPQEAYVEITAGDGGPAAVLPGLGRGFCPDDSIQLSKPIPGTYNGSF